jgi:alpha-mannosidase
VHDITAGTRLRLDRFLADRIRPALHTAIAPLDLQVWHIPGDGEPVPPAQALAAEYQPAELGLTWGTPWRTSWFHLTGTVPESGAGQAVELVLDLGWDNRYAGFRGEGLVYRPDGSPVKGLHPRNNHVPVGDPASGGERIDLYVEAAANPQIEGFRPTMLGDKATVGDRPIYQVTVADIAIRHVEVAELIADLEALGGLAELLPADSTRAARLWAAISRCLDALDPADIPGTAAAARERLAPELAVRATEGTHVVTAVAHSHIDSAWLWPTRETIRKVARTTSNVVALLQANPDVVYAMSSAQQYEWIQQHRPEVFERVAEQVRDGRFVPVGGMWVESDTNMVGGEAMARQFSMGQRYFRDTFGITCREGWLPDSFGYTAALPQILRLGGCRYFLTQKISWNRVNPFPHHTFQWEGIDGSRIFTHFPPADTYSAEVTAKEMVRVEHQFRDKAVATRSLLPFGHGDGGGGPTREMIARAQRFADLAGSAKIEFGSPAQFFADAEAEYPDAPVWTGELYLEIHRGTYTSQAKTKQGNRRSEHLLREAELWCATAAVRGLADYPYDEIDRIWKTVLLNQFHDILPGSGIAWVANQAIAEYAGVMADLERVIDGAITALTDGSAGSAAPRTGGGLAGSTGSGDDPTGHQPLLFNASPFPRAGVAPLSAGPVTPAESEVQVDSDGGDTVLDNGLLRARIDGRGLLTAVTDLRSGREVLAPGTAANLLQLHTDTPAQWDAWDIDPDYRDAVTDLTDLDSLQVRDDGGAVTVVVTRSVGESAITQEISLAPGAAQLEFAIEIDWHEREKLLKVAFPLDVHTDHAAYETQFGHLVRPTHTNTSWDAARFEVCAHRWVQLAEPGYGIAIVNDSTYGHDVTRHARPGGGSYSTVRLSLLRAPRYPDPEADQGLHRMRYALVPGATVLDAARAGYEINLPARSTAGRSAVQPLLAVQGPGTVLVESVKLADDRSGDVIVRLYEPLGGRAEVTVRPSFTIDSAVETDLLEDDLARVDPNGGIPRALLESDGQAVRLSLRPFQIVTLRLRPTGG